MEEGGNNMEVTHESRRENFVPQDVESATRSDMSSGSWRLSVPEFPTLDERRDGDEHGFFTLSSLLHVPSKSSFMNTHTHTHTHQLFHNMNRNYINICFTHFLLTSLIHGPLFNIFHLFGTASFLGCVIGRM